MITSLMIDNFRSLKNVDVEFGAMNFIVGPNASGKSNLVAALDFLSHTVSENLQYAVAEQGGFFNMSHRRQRRARGSISFRLNSRVQLEGDIGFEFRLSFELRARGEDIRADFYVAAEQLLMTVQSPGEAKSQINIFRETPENEPPKYVTGSSGPLFDKGRVDVPDVISDFKLLARMPNLLRESLRAEPQGLLISGFLKGFSLLRTVTDELQGCRVFQLNPRIAREPSAPSVRGDLGRRGENLPSALDQMRTKDPKGFDRLSLWIRDVLPTLTTVITDYTDTRQLGLFFQEEGFSSRWFAEDISDGTIMALALFFALLDKRHTTVIIEEPENTLHPWVLRKFVERCREQSAERQIIITTHSPLVVAHAKPEELYLMERNDGMSRIARATELEKNLDQIIRDDLIDLGEYWLSGGLGAVPSAPENADDELFDKQ